MSERGGDGGEEQKYVPRHSAVEAAADAAVPAVSGEAAEVSGEAAKSDPTPAMPGERQVASEVSDVLGAAARAQIERDERTVAVADARGAVVAAVQDKDKQPETPEPETPGRPGLFSRVGARVGARVGSGAYRVARAAGADAARNLINRVGDRKPAGPPVVAGGAAVPGEGIQQVTPEPETPDRPGLLRRAGTAAMRGVEVVTRPSRKRAEEMLTRPERAKEAVRLVEELRKDTKPAGPPVVAGGSGEGARHAVPASEVPNGPASEVQPAAPPSEVQPAVPNDGPPGGGPKPESRPPGWRPAGFRNKGAWERFIRATGGYPVASGNTDASDQTVATGGNTVRPTQGQEADGPNLREIAAVAEAFQSVYFRMAQARADADAEHSSRPRAVSIGSETMRGHDELYAKVCEKYGVNPEEDQALITKKDKFDQPRRPDMPSRSIITRPLTEIFRQAFEKRSKLRAPDGNPLVMRIFPTNDEKVALQEWRKELPKDERGGHPLGGVYRTRLIYLPDGDLPEPRPHSKDSKHEHKVNKKLRGLNAIAGNIPFDADTGPGIKLNDENLLINAAQQWGIDSKPGTPPRYLPGDTGRPKGPRVLTQAEERQDPFEPVVTSPTETVASVEVPGGPGSTVGREPDVHGSEHGPDAHDERRGRPKTGLAAMETPQDFEDGYNTAMAALAMQPRDLIRALLQLKGAAQRRLKEELSDEDVAGINGTLVRISEAIAQAKRRGGGNL